MKIDLLNIDEMISIYNLKEVTSPRLMAAKGMYDANGILSNEIFGISEDDRKKTFAYIDLKKPFLHPHIYENVLKRMFKNITGIVSGQMRFSIINGLLTSDENGWTGLSNLYDYWDDIDWRKLNSANKNNTRLITRLKRDQVFITRTLVCPPSYRFVMLSGSMDSSDHINELNDFYSRLIRASIQLSEGGLFSRTQYAIQMKIQDTLVDIFNYCKSQISKKHGIIRKNLMGKNIDYGSRSVISAPNYNKETIYENIVDIEHSAVPLAQCCSTFYPFIEAWVKNFLTREIINNPNIVAFYDSNTNKEIVGTIIDADVQFSEREIRKMINDFILNPDNRFKPIIVNVLININNKEKLVKSSVILKGKILQENNIQQVLNRAMTITDVLYLACVDVCERRHILVTRYPVGTDKGLYLNKPRVQTTRKHVYVIFNGKEYPNYPYIDFNIPTEKVGIQFIDSLVPSNSLLDGLGRS